MTSQSHKELEDDGCLPKAAGSIMIDRYITYNMCGQMAWEMMVGFWASRVLCAGHSLGGSSAALCTPFMKAVLPHADVTFFGSGSPVSTISPVVC